MASPPQNVQTDLYALFAITHDQRRSVEFQFRQALREPLHAEPDKASVPLNMQYLTNGGVTPAFTLCHLIFE